MSFVWTLPHPLNNTAKTKSIYIVELQIAINTKRDDIAQSSLTFVDASTGKVYKYTHISEMKTAIENLATAYGYSGIADPLLLGHDWTLIPQKHDQISTTRYLWTYIILNEMREILDKLVFSLFRENWEFSDTQKYTSTTYFYGQDNKKWKAYVSALSSFIEITSVKDAYVYFIPPDAPVNRFFGLEYNKLVGDIKWKIKANAKLYFDINSISIPWAYYAGKSYDAFLAQVKMTGYPGTPFIDCNLSYWYNYDPVNTFWIGATHLMGSIGVGSHSVNLYSDLINDYSEAIKYYDGTYDTRGLYLYQALFEMSATCVAGATLHQFKIDNIKVKV